MDLFALLMDPVEGEDTLLQLPVLQHLLDTLKDMDIMDVVFICAFARRNQFVFLLGLFIKKHISLKELPFVKLVVAFLVSQPTTGQENGDRDLPRKKYRVVAVWR